MMNRKPYLKFITQHVSPTMFEAAEIGRSLSKDEYDEREVQLRTELIQMQYELRSADFPVIILLAGDDRPGCDDTIKLLNTWLDPRFLETNAFGPPSDEERERPPLWRFWRALPPRGKIGIFAGGWALRVLGDRLAGEIDEADWLRAIGYVRRLEQMLVDDGAVLVKFWLHLAKKKLKKRLQEAEKDPDHHWRVQPEDWEIYRNYHRGLDVVETLVRKTSTGESPWHVVESTDANYRDVAVSEILQESVRDAMDESARPQGQPSLSIHSNDRPTRVEADPHTVLDTLDLSLELAKKDYNKQLEKQQARLHGLARRMHEQEQSAVLVFEGWDAGGKGGTIRRLVAAINAQMYRIVPVAAPSEEERRYHYLWRFWRHLPRAGRVLVFDRSWYGRVLVERVEGYAREDEWQRAYGEINDFEEQLCRHGLFLGKFWLHISPDEQLKRFESRKETPYKRFKITKDDYRNREKWHDYEAAAGDMVARTSTSYAPWHLIPANDKRYARVEVLRIVCEGLERTLEEAGDRK